MKLIQTLELTDKEKEKFFKFCERMSPPSSDDMPCGFVNCGDTRCDACPFIILQDKFAEFQEVLEKVKKMIK